MSIVYIIYYYVNKFEATSLFSTSHLEIFVSEDKPKSKTFFTQGKKNTHMGKKPHTYFFSRGGVHLPLPLLRASMSKSEYEMHNIFGNYSSHNDTKNTL